MYVHLCIHEYIHMQMCLQIVCICISAHTSGDMYIHIDKHSCMYTPVYIYIYICMLVQKLVFTEGNLTAMHTRSLSLYIPLNGATGWTQGSLSYILFATSLIHVPIGSRS